MNRSKIKFYRRDIIEMGLTIAEVFVSEFSAQQAMEGDLPVLSFSGPIDENVKFPEVAVSGSQLILDLNEVTYINSIGIKMWIQWITPLAGKVQIEFRRCPKSIIFQINMVKNFLPENCNVSSFYLPLFCEECDKETSTLISVASDVKVEGESVEITKDFSQIKDCDGEECEWEVDVIEKKYFRFLHQ